MYGYLRVYKRQMPRELHLAYKNYYCGTCFALQYNYGNLSRFLLSYDIVLLGLLTKPHEEPLCKRLRCFGHRGKTQFKGENWKKIAALSLLFAREMIKDNIEDENSFIAKVADKIYSKKIKKAEQDYPIISSLVESCYKQILAYEKENKGLFEIAGVFSGMMGQVYKLIHGDDALCSEKAAYIKAVSEWVYFIDALDDYGKDIEKKRYNPLIKNNVSHADYIDKHFLEIHGLICQIYEKIRKAINELKLDGVEDELLKKIVFNTIPSMTAIVLNRDKQPKMKHFREMFGVAYEPENNDIH